MDVEIPLSADHICLIDDADELLVAGFNWRPLKLKHTYYAHAWHGQMHIYMHRLVAGAPPQGFVDHVNRNGLDNRRANLRIATKSENGANRVADARVRRTSSEYKGVFWDRARGKWAATIHVDGRSKALGRFGTEMEAAEAYNRAATATWGRFARLNLFPTQVVSA